MEFKKFKRIVSGCCAAIMMSSFVLPVAAEGNSEVDFSLKYWDYFNSLTKSVNLSEFTRNVNLKELKYQYESDALNSDREDIIKRVGKASEKVKIDENYTYNELLGIVRSLISRVDETTPGHKNYLGVPGDNLDKPREWRIAKDIYSWVTDNIKYDYESLQEDERGESSFRKPQDALFVYSQRKGVCLGKANLIYLMMRMAEIPSVVIGTPKHAYNAIYLKNNDINRSGWTFIDATWGAPKSDLGYVAEAGKLIKGEVGTYRSWVQDTFNRDNAYTKAVENLAMVPENMEKNDKSVNELNAKIKKELSNLNNNVDNDFKFTDIKVVMRGDKGSEWFVLEYKTDLDYDKAEAINDELKNRQILRGYINYTSVIGDDGKLDNYFDKWYLEINEQQDKSKEYINKLNDICVKNCKKDQVSEIEKDIEKVNENINTEIEKLNIDFKDIVTIESAKLKVIHDMDDWHSDEGALMIDLKANLTFDDATKIANKRLNAQNIEKNKEYFPAFYNGKLNFADINKDMIQKENHEIMSINDSTIHTLHNKDVTLVHRWNLTINGAKYNWHIDEKGKSYIEVDVEDENRNNVVEIDSDVAKLGMPLKIGYRIKSLKLIGDQTVDISSAISLTNVDVSASNKYEGFDNVNRKLINKGEGLVQPKKDGSLSEPEKANIESDDWFYRFRDKQKRFFAVLDDFNKFKDSKGIYMVENYNYDIVTKCFNIFPEVHDSNYNSEKVKEAEMLMDKAIEQINRFKQKLSDNN